MAGMLNDYIQGFNSYVKYDWNPIEIELAKASEEEQERFNPKT